MKNLILVSILVLAAAAAFGQVDRDELAKGQGTAITFVNYVGPHTVVDTLAQIVGIGSGLGRSVGSVSGEFTFAGKYRLLHVIGAPAGDKLDADVFILEPGATVDDVVNIMRMVSGYLQAAYKYSPADAMTLAKFVVYYNAVFRGNLAYLGGVYKTEVMATVTADNAGIATKWTDWPGKTRMVIPLSTGAQKGSLTAVPAGQLATPQVIQNLQTQPGQALPERKDLTELQQRGIEEQQQKQQAQEQQLSQQQQQLQQAQANAQAANAAAAQPGATEQQKQQAAQANAEVQKQQAAVAQQQQAVTQTQAQIAADQKSVQEQRASIASDQQKQIQQQAAQPGAATTAGTTAAPGQVLFIYAVASPEKLGQFVLIDRVSGKLLAKSDLNSVRGRLYVTVGGSLVVVAGTTGGNAAVRLVSVDPASLAVKQQGKDNIALTSYIAASDTAVFAVLNTPKGAFLGKFDGNLALQAQSDKAVDPSTDIVLSGTEVFVQDSGGNIVILSQDDLKERKRTGSPM